MLAKSNVNAEMCKGSSVYELFWKNESGQKWWTLLRLPETDLRGVDWGWVKPSCAQF